MYVSRLVKFVGKTAEHNSYEESQELSSLRATPAWVLLGEPGAGKSTVFEQEAEASGGIRISIADFISFDLDDAWRGKTLYLDGLDEVRASASNQGTLQQVRKRLTHLGMPSFRIACRAADWYGQSDQVAITGASPNSELPVFALQPLDDAGIYEILKNHFESKGVEEFISRAEANGMRELLCNPQTLLLIIDAVKENEWPNSRDETYHLACRAQLKETSRAHRNLNRQQQQASAEDQLDAAGQLFASLLLSDKSGLAIDDDGRSERYPLLEELKPNSLALARSVCGTRLFKPSVGMADQLEPSHRSIGEYLAARWLAKQMNDHGLPLGRILNMMLGFDKKAVAGLRGLYGWLALLSLKSRSLLIRQDPLTVILYGDPAALSIESKRLLLQVVLHQIRSTPEIFWHLGDSTNLGAVFDLQLVRDVVDVLEDPHREDGDQTCAVFLLKVLAQSGSHIHIANNLRAVALDESRWYRVRRLALEVWLGSNIPATEALDFLDQLNAGEINDPDEELAGILLESLFPENISSHNVLKYLRTPKMSTGSMYTYFWAYKMPQVAASSDIPELLDQLSQRNDLKFVDRLEFHLPRMCAALVSRGVVEHGDNISDERLFTWLKIGADEYGENRREKKYQEVITNWLIARPHRYKGLLQICFQRSADNINSLNLLFNHQQILQGISPPPDIGFWHLEQVDSTKSEELAKQHLTSAVRSLWSGHGNEGLSLERLFEWANEDPKKLKWLNSELVWEISDWRLAQNQSSQQRQHDHEKIKQQRSHELTTQISSIAAGTASPFWLGQMAGVWANRYTDARGDTPLDRFKNYCINYEEVFAAAQSGLRACVARSDLPTIGEIIDLSLKNREHYIRPACLLGMELLWEDGHSSIDALDDVILEHMVCFRLTDGTDKTPDWFLHLVTTRPELVSRVMVAYATAKFKSKADHVSGVHPLASDIQYENVARSAVPALLERFPTRSKSQQLRYLEIMLKAALRYAMPELSQIIRNKLKLKTLGAGQKIYYLLTGMLAWPEEYEKELWKFVGDTWQRIEFISDFLGSRFNDLPLDLGLNAKALSKLIELQTPYAEIELPQGGGWVTPAMRLGEHVNALIIKLASLGTKNSVEEIDRLLAIPTLDKIKRNLKSARLQSIQHFRENQFSFPLLDAVAAILANKAPTDPADLQALVLAHLDDIAIEIRSSNRDLFRQFWTEGEKNKHKSENSCRDSLLVMLDKSLTNLGIECTHEVDHFNDKRADICLNYRNQIELPIEVKGEWHSDLWRSIGTQLIPRYTTTIKSGGFGIYLVLWVGGSEQPPAKDGIKKPTTPQELEKRLADTIPPEAQNFIAVRVIDISWPK